nr:hypothetical protein [Planctomycetota bacterium]
AGAAGPRGAAGGGAGGGARAGGGGGGRAPPPPRGAGGGGPACAPGGSRPARGPPGGAPAARRNRLRTLREGSESGFPTWLAETDRAGLLSELLLGCEIRLQEDRGALDPRLVLERWGALLDPLPPGLDRQDRFQRLWEGILDASPARAALLTGRLLVELAPSAQGDPTRQLTVSELRQALRQEGPEVRRAACLAAGHQATSVLFEPLLEASLADPNAAVREAAASAAAAMLRLESRNYWVLVLARGEAKQRPAAADALGRHGGEAAVHPLAHVLSAYDKKAPRGYDFAGRRIQVRRSVSRQDPSSAHRSGLEVEILDQGNSFEVAPLDEATTQALLRALTTLRPDGPPEGSPAGWVDWYLENLRPGTP